MKKYLLILLSSATVYAQAEQIMSIVEFFSYTCSHCANVNHKLDSYVATHPVEFFAINTDNGDNAIPTNIAYYVAVDAGIGSQFKSTYFTAVASGMPAYTPQTLNYVINQIKTPTYSNLLKSSDEKEKVKNKLAFANYLSNKYRVQATPTFLINQSTLLEGEAIINSLN